MPEFYLNAQHSQSFPPSPPDGTATPERGENGIHFHRTVLKWLRMPQKTRVLTSILRHKGGGGGGGGRKEGDTVFWRNLRWTVGMQSRAAPRLSRCATQPATKEADALLIPAPRRKERHTWTGCEPIRHKFRRGGGGGREGKPSDVFPSLPQVRRSSFQSA